MKILPFKHIVSFCINPNESNVTIMERIGIVNEVKSNIQIKLIALVSDIGSLITPVDDSTNLVNYYDLKLFI